MRSMRKVNLSYLSWVLVITILASIFPIGPQRVMASGSGTELDPYLVYTAEDLSDIRLDLSAHYRLEDHIDLASYDSGDDGGWLPIGAVNDTTSNAFTGSL